MITQNYVFLLLSQLYTEIHKNGINYSSQNMHKIILMQGLHKSDLVYPKVQAPILVGSAPLFIRDLRM